MTYTRDVWLPSLASSLMNTEGRFLCEIFGIPREPIDPTIKWYRRLPDHEIDAEVVGDWVEPDEPDWDDCW
jgi:hypothetical protein